MPEKKFILPPPKGPKRRIINWNKPLIWRRGKVVLLSMIKKNWSRQVILSVMLLVLVAGIFNSDSTVAKQAQHSIRQLFAADYDLGPVTETLSRLSHLTGTVNVMGKKLIRSDAKLVAPLSGKVVRGYGNYISPVDGQSRLHQGIDYEAPPGTPVQAAGDGEVSVIMVDSLLGRFVKIDHGQGLIAVYAQVDEILVRQGQKVRQGDVLAILGPAKSGLPRLHFELYDQGKVINPAGKLSGNGDAVQ